MEKNQRLQLLAGTLGVESLQDEADRASELRRREEAAAAAAAGWPEVKTETGDEMRQTILGDNITVAAPQTAEKPQPKSGLSKLAKAGIAAALLGSGAGIPAGIGFVLDALKEKPPIVQPVIPDSVDTIGKLGFDE